MSNDARNDDAKAEDDTPFFQTLSLDVQIAVQGLRGVEVQVVNTWKEFQKEVLALEAKYAKQCAQLYEHRARVIAGSEGVTSKELNAGERQSKQDEEDYENLAAPNRTVFAATPITDFWLRVLKTYPETERLTSPQDEPALKYLSDIKVTYPNSLTFVVEFYFKSNPYFTNSVLKKTYIYKDELGFFGTLLYSHVTGDTIRWKSGQNIIAQIAAAAKAKEGNDEDEDDEESTSFFSFFEPGALITVPEDQVPEQAPKDKKEGDDEDEDEEEDDRDDLLDKEFDIGEAFKDRIIHHSVEYYTKEALDYEEDDFDFDFDDDDEEEDEDEDAEEDEDN
ncbi:nucleosome assembly protein [Flammula alnicola]|nr:nucleosome assembly protein [Flammula alnicola]